MFKHLYRDRRIFALIFAAILGGAAMAAPALAQPNEKELFLVAQKAFEDGFYDVAIRYLYRLRMARASQGWRIRAMRVLWQLRRRSTY